MAQRDGTRAAAAAGGGEGGRVGRRRAPLVRAVMASGLLASVGVVGTQAAFTDTATSGGSFTTGTLDVNVSPTSALFNVTDMAPGDVVYAGLTITNGGSLPLQHALATTATNGDAKDLRSALTAEVRVAALSCTSATFAASLTTYAPEVTGLQALAAGAPRSLAAGGSEILCFRLALPSSAGNALQGATTTATFTFSATQ